MCKCYDEMKEKLREHFVQKAPEGSTDIDVELKGYMFGITNDGGMVHRVSNDVTVTYQAPKKSGGMKKVTNKTYIRATYCPFCGVEYAKSEQAAREAAAGPDIEYLK